jgi:hypothetical protein
MDKLRQIIREIAKQRNLKPDCGCGCSGKCGGEKAPVINENLIRKPLLSEHLQYHVDNKKLLTENTFRYGSSAFLDLWKEARKLYSRNLLEVSGLDKDIIVETNLGEYGIYEGQEVPLDLPMIEEGQMLDNYEVDFFHTKANVYANIEIPSENPTFEDDIQIKGTGKTEEEAFEDLKQNYNNYKKTGINEAKYQGKEVQLNKPKRGGSKKFFVYVMNPKTKKVKKVQFGAAGGGQNLAVKIRDPKARRAFASRQNCDKKKDRTTPGYWSCNIGRYWKSLGGGSNFSGYW